MDITREEANELYAHKTRVLEKGFSMRVDRIELSVACQEFYTEFLGEQKPEVFIAEGPIDASFLLNHLIGKRFSTTHEQIASFGSRKNHFSLRKEIDRSVFSRAKSAKEHLKESLGIDKFREVRNILFRDLNFQFSQSVYHVTEKSIQNRLKQTGLDSVEFAAHPSFADRDWLDFYRSCSALFGFENPIPTSYSNLIDNGLFSGFFFRDFTVLVPKPVHIHKNDNLVLHHEEHAAVSWPDKTHLAYWNGVEVPLSLITEPERITAADILNETNAEVRRCYQEKLGSEKFGSLLGLMDLDKKTDRFGNELVLYRTKKIDELAGDFIYFAKVVCPSTGRIYFLCVPPGMSSVEEAVSWTFGKTPEDYTPSIET